MSDAKTEQETPKWWEKSHPQQRAMNKPVLIRTRSTRQWIKNRSLPPPPPSGGKSKSIRRDPREAKVCVRVSIHAHSSVVECMATSMSQWKVCALRQLYVFRAV